MSAIGDLVELLLSTGTSADVVRRAIDLAQLHAEQSSEHRPSIVGLSADSSAERRKAYDRERQAKIRRAKKDALLLPSSSLSESQEKKEGVIGRAARGTRLPSDWTLSNADACFALPLLGERRMAQETEKFRDYWHARAGPGGIKLDWAATWRTWIRNAGEKHGKSNGKSSPTMDAFDDLIAGTGGAVAGDPPMRDITPRGGDGR